MTSDYPQALSESAEMFAKVFQFCPDALSVQDYASRQFLEVNEGFELLFGYPRAEVIGRTAVELGLWAHPEERDRAVEAVRAQGSLRDELVLGRRKDGSVRYCHLSLQRIEIGGRACFIAVIRDVTASLRAEGKLRESEEKFSKVFRASPDAIAIVDFESGRLLEVNSSYEKVFGFSREEMIGHTTLELNIYQDPADRPRLIDSLRPTGSVRNYELACQNRRGEPVMVNFSGEVIELGGRICLMSVIHDLTESKRAAARELSARQEFTRRLIASQEAERRRIAGELHDSLGQDLLLIKNRAALALDASGAPPEHRGPLENIQDMAVLAIAEVRRISHDLRPYQLDQLGLTRALAAMIAGAARNSGFPFERRLDAVDDVFAPEAATHLYRVVQESLNNVLKHARATAAKIELERDVREVTLRIADDGRGFVPPAPDSDPSTGGLGLRNIAERVRILGGSLAVDSAPGQGTRITVTIPFTPPP